MKEIEKAVQVLREAFKKDPDFAHTWHCNIAMAFYDSLIIDNSSERVKLLINAIANDGAARFMKMAFDVDVDTYTPEVSA